MGLAQRFLGVPHTYDGDGRQSRHAWKPGDLSIKLANRPARV
jgi:hypothetical protein